MSLSNTAAANAPLAPQVVYEHRRRILDTLRAFRTSQVLMACAELGVFELLANGPRTEAEIADALQTDRRGMGLLLNTAAAFEFLIKHDGRFANAPMADNCLARRDAHYIGDILKLDGAFYRRWGHLASAVKTGQRPEENIRDEDAGDWVRNFELAMYKMAQPVAPVIADALALPEDSPLHVLDVGGGHGGYSIALARRYPLLTATVFELPRVVPVAREIIAQAGMADRVSVQEGDFQRDDLGNGYDVALVFGVLNGESEAGRAALVARVHACLKPGGRIVIREYVLDSDRAGPPEAALFALQMLLATDSGGLSTFDEVTQWLRDAGFVPPQLLPLPAGIGAPLIVADKLAQQGKIDLETE
jgi:SAM-dependent methyltransferase